MNINHNLHIPLRHFLNKTESTLYNCVCIYILLYKTLLTELICIKYVVRHKTHIKQLYTQKSTSYIAILKFLTQTFIPSPVLSAPLSTGRIGRSSVLSSFVLLRVASVSQLSFPPVLQFRANLSHCQSAAPE